MRKVDQSQRNSEKWKNPFYHENVVDYQQDMRVDRLTTTQEIQREASEISKKVQEAERLKAAEAAAKAAAEKAEYEAWKEERAKQSDDKPAT